MDSLKNFAASLVATAPSPATSGTSLVVTAGQGSYFPATPFDATIWPSGTQPTNTNAEIVRVTNVSTDTFTITRAQYGTTAQSIAVGYQIAQTVDANLLSQLAPLSGATFTGEVVAPDFKVSGLTGATAATRYVGGTINGAPTSGTFAVGDFIVDQTATIWVCLTAGTPGTWWSTISNHAVLRTATATAGKNEVTIFSGSTASQTISAVASPADGATWTFINQGTVNVTAGFASNSMYPLGSASSVTSYVIAPNSSYTFINYNGGNWYMTSTNNLTNGTGVLPTANGGTGTSTAPAVGSIPVASSTSAYTPLAIGTSGQVLQSNGTTATWSSSTVSSFNGRTGAVVPASGDYGTATGVIPTTTQIAGKNKIINGDFYFSQRGTVFNYGSGGLSATSYNMDRWILDFNGNPILTVQQLSFANGTSLPGYIGGEPQYYANITCSSVGSGNTFHEFDQRIENARLFNGQPVTISFWAKCDSARTISLRLDTSGSPNDTLNLFSNVNLSTSWAFYQATMTMPNITAAGSYSTNSYLRLVFGLGTVSTSENFSFYGVQVEAGSVATQFTTATGTIQGELAACQRYYWQQNGGSSQVTPIAPAFLSSTTTAQAYLQLPVTMRIAPTWSYSAVADIRVTWSAGTSATSSLNQDLTTPTTQSLRINTSGLTTGQGGYFLIDIGSSKYLAFSAEL